MSEDHYKDGNYGINLIGPFTQKPYKISVAGYLLPYVVAYESEERPGYWALVLDDRIMTDYLPLEWLNPVLGFLGDCMAFSAGYAHHGENASKINPWACQIAGIDIEPKKPNIKLVKTTTEEK